MTFVDLACCDNVGDGHFLPLGILIGTVTQFDGVSLQMLFVDTHIDNHLAARVHIGTQCNLRLGGIDQNPHWRLRARKGFSVFIQCLDGEQVESFGGRAKLKVLLTRICGPLHLPRSALVGRHPQLNLSRLRSPRVHIEWNLELRMGKVHRFDSVGCPVWSLSERRLTEDRTATQGER